MSGPCGVRTLLPHPGARGKRPAVAAGVVYHRRVARTELHRFDELFLLERILSPDGEVGNFALGREVHLERHLDDEVRGALEAGPASGKIGQRGSGGGPFRGPALRPSDDRVDLRLAEGPDVLEPPVAHIGVPGGHLPRDDLFLDRPRPGPRLLVRGERHRSHLAVPMAAGAVVENDRRHVGVEGRHPFGLGGTRPRRHGCRDQPRQPDDCPQALHRSPPRPSRTAHLVQRIGSTPKHRAQGYIAT